MNIKAEMRINSGTTQGKKKPIENVHAFKNINHASFNMFHEPINLSFK